MKKMMKKDLQNLAPQNSTQFAAWLRHTCLPVCDASDTLPPVWIRVEWVGKKIHTLEHLEERHPPYTP